MPLSKTLLEEIEQNKYKYHALRIGTGELDDDDLIKLAKAIRKNTYITVLDLGGNFISDIAANELSTLDNLKELYFQEASVSTEGIRAIIKSKLRNLDISGCGVEDDDLVGIESNTTLKELVIDPGYITKKGIELLSKNKSLEVIDVRNCRIINPINSSVEVVEDISRLFLGHPSLLKLYLEKGKPPILFEKKKKKEEEEIASSSSSSSSLSSVQVPITYAFEAHKNKDSSETALSNKPSEKTKPGFD